MKPKPYERKLSWIYGRFDEMRVPWQVDCIKLIMKRDLVVDYALGQILPLKQYDMRKEFQIHFDGEIAQDAGGLMREWLGILISKLFDEELGLFQMTRTDNVSYFLPIKKYYENLDLYILTGKALGKAIFERIPINCPLSRVLLKSLLGEKLELDDLFYVDTELYRSLKFMRDNDITHIFYEKFVVWKEVNGVKEDFELLPGGRHLAVTEENKDLYVTLRAQFELIDGIKEPFQAFKEGFFTVVPSEVIMALSPDELEITICGLPCIDLTDMKEYTKYRGIFSPSHKVVIWFWEVLATFSPEQLSQMLHFVTGTSRLPIQGFRALRTLRGEGAPFTLEPMTNFGDDSLPRAHTCFNRIDLPLYSCKDTLRKALLYVIENHSSGFGLE